MKLCLVFFLLAVTAAAQNAGLSVHVTEKATKEDIPFAKVCVMRKGIIISGGPTDVYGTWVGRNLSPDTVDVKVIYVGYTSKEVKKVLLLPGKTTMVSVEMEEGRIQLDALEVVSYVVPKIDPDTLTPKQKRKQKRKERKLRKKTTPGS